MLCIQERFSWELSLLDIPGHVIARWKLQCWISLSLHSKHSPLSATHVRGQRCNSDIEYTAYSSVWIMGVHLLHSHWYRINRHTNQGQRVLSGSTHCPSVILASGGRQPQPSRGVASSIKSLRYGEARWRILESRQFQRITLKHVD